MVGQAHRSRREHKTLGRQRGKRVVAAISYMAKLANGQRLTALVKAAAAAEIATAATAAGGSEGGSSSKASYRSSEAKPQPTNRGHAAGAGNSNGGDGGANGAEHNPSHGGDGGANGAERGRTCWCSREQQHEDEGACVRAQNMPQHSSVGFITRQPSDVARRRAAIAW